MNGCVFEVQAHAPEPQKRIRSFIDWRSAIASPKNEEKAPCAKIQIQKRYPLLFGTYILTMALVICPL